MNAVVGAISNDAMPRFLPKFAWRYTFLGIGVTSPLVLFTVEWNGEYDAK
jgi:hypothetical protein